ncbi:hypothetical protein GCM10020000_56460 [Streptomyces olivoverticillatus]
MPVAQEASGQSESREQASKPRVMESPSEAIDAGRGFQAGRGLGLGRAAVGPASLAPPPSSHPVASRAAASTVTAARTTVDRLRLVAPSMVFSPSGRVISVLDRRYVTPGTSSHGSFFSGPDNWPTAYNTSHPVAFQENCHQWCLLLVTS